MPLRTAQTLRVMAATGRGGVDRHAECPHHLQLFHAARRGGREMQAVSSVVESQILTRLTYYKYYNFDLQLREVAM